MRGYWRLAILIGRGVRAVLVAVGTLVTEGPVGAWIHGWSDGTARMAWTAIVGTLAGLTYVAIFEHGIPSIACSLLLLPLGLVTVFVHTVRAGLREAREAGALRLSRRGRRAG